MRTPPFAHYGVKFSPFHPQLFALASSANYGLIGNGRAHIARLLTPEAPPTHSPEFSGSGIQLEKGYLLDVPLISDDYPLPHL